MNNATVDVLPGIGSVSLLDLFQQVWDSLDDIIVCVGILILSLKCTRSLHFCMRSYFGCMAYISQAVHFAVLFTITVFLMSHLVGMETAKSLFGGFSIGIGYAMQPYIVSLVAGGTFLFTSILRAGDRLEIGQQTVIVDHVGLLYVAAKTGKTTTYFPNSMLASSPFSVMRS